MASFIPEKLTSSLFVEPTTGIGPFTTGDPIRFEFHRDKVDFSTISIFMDVYASNATSTFPETCGCASLVKELRFNCGGLDVDVFRKYPDYIAANMMSNQTYGSDPSRNGGPSDMYGRGATLGSGTGNSVVYKLPLKFGFIEEGYKFSMAQFHGKATIELILNTDIVGLFDTVGTSGTYTIKRIWMTYHDFRDEDIMDLVSGDVINVNKVQAVDDIAKTSGTIIFPLTASNVTKIRVAMNLDVTGYDATTDDKFRSNIANVTSMNIVMRGKHYPRRTVGYRDFITEAYQMSYLANRVTASTNHIDSDFIDYSDFGGAVKHGFITFQLYGRTKSMVHEGGIGKILGGTKLTGQDSLVYEQSVATGMVQVFIEYTNKLYYKGGYLTERAEW